MKKLLQEDVEKIFNDFGCRLIGEYISASKPVRYICSCGSEGLISLNKLRSRKKGCSFCYSHSWSVFEDEILSCNYGKISRNEILSLLPGLNYNQIKNRAHFLGLKGNRSLVSSKIIHYNFNEKFFDDINELSSYWSGYIAGMGSISSKRLILNGKNSVLNNFIIDCGIDYKKEYYDQIVLYGISPWIKSLDINFNIKVAKKKSVEPCYDLSEKFSLCYISGYILGRGDLKDEDFKIYGSNELLCWIKVWFDKICPSVKRRISVINPYSRGLYVYKINCNRMKYILGFLNKKRLGVV